MMGATLTQQYYFTESTTDTQIAELSQSAKIRDIKYFYARQNNQNSDTKTSTVNGETVTYASTAIRPRPHTASAAAAASMTARTRRCIIARWFPGSRSRHRR